MTHAVWSVAPGFNCGWCLNVANVITASAAKVHLWRWQTHRSDLAASTATSLIRGRATTSKLITLTDPQGQTSTNKQESWTKPLLNVWHSQGPALTTNNQRSGNVAAAHLSPTPPARCLARPSPRWAQVGDLSKVRGASPKRNRRERLFFLPFRIKIHTLDSELKSATSITLIASVQSNSSRAAS